MASCHGTALFWSKGTLHQPALFRHDSITLLARVVSSRRHSKIVTAQVTAVAGSETIHGGNFQAQGVGDAGTGHVRIQFLIH